MNEIEKRYDCIWVFIYRQLRFFNHPLRLSDVLPSVRSNSDLAVLELSLWCLTFLSKADVEWSNAWADHGVTVVLEGLLESTFAVCSTCAAEYMVLTISPVVVSQVILAEHLSASLPQDWTEESAVVEHVFVLTFAVFIGRVGASGGVAFGVWDSHTFNLAQGVMSMGFIAAAYWVFGIDVGWYVLLHGSHLLLHHWVWSHHCHSWNFWI